MLDKIVTFLVEKFAPIGILTTLLITLGFTVFEANYFQLTDSETIILYFFFTLLITSFIFLLIAKIFELSRENPIEEKEEKEDE